MMKLRRWCVTIIMDNWTPTRKFFTRARAERHAARHPGCALWHWHSAQWRSGEWEELWERVDLAQDGAANQAHKTP
jgi:hypothetical protein